MAFYIAKGLQVAGLLGVGVALYIGMTDAGGMAKELGGAALGIAIFYAGRLVEGGERGKVG